MIDNTNELKKIYLEIVKDLEKEFSNEIFYNKHVLNSKFYKIENQNIYIIVENQFIKDVLKDYQELFNDAFASKLNTSLNTIFITEEEKITKKVVTQNEKPKTNNKTLDKNMTLDNLVVGLFNEDAVRAANMIFNGTNTWYSIYIHGKTGLGKTHLLNAIGNKYQELFPEKNVLFLQTEDFYRNVYNAISLGGSEVEKYKDSFNEVDLLLIDDVQFLSNKEKMNEIFFTIFNRMQKNKKIIIMSSDKIVNGLKMEDRMVSRFNAGLVVKINKPDIDVIKKIIINKINNSNRNNQFSMPAIEYLALRFNSDIRTLEGVLNKILFHSLNEMSKNEIINEDKIKSILDSDNDFEIISNNLNINPELVIELVCIAYNVDIKSVISKKRNKEFSFVRKICMYILREKLDYSYNQIGSYFSNRNHATVLESIRDVEKKLETDEHLKNFIEKIMSKL